jgi:hypothetical protein
MLGFRSYLPIGLHVTYWRDKEAARAHQRARSGYYSLSLTLPEVGPEDLGLLEGTLSGRQGMVGAARASSLGQRPATSLL